MISTMRGRFEQKKKTLDARRVMDRIFIIQPNWKLWQTHSQEVPSLSQSTQDISTHDTSLSTQEEEVESVEKTYPSWTA